LSVIVTDARYRMSLAVIRSLGQAGVRVVAQEEKGISSLDALGFHSRHTSRTILTASSRREPDAFVDDLLRAGGDERDVLIPVSLSSVLAVARRAEDVKKRFRVALPSLDAIATANDTQRLLEVAQRVGVPVPETVVLEPGDEPESLLGRVKFPVVIKYREGEGLGLPPEQRYAIARDPSSLLQTYRAMASRQASPLVQEFISGDGWGMSALFNMRSDAVAAFCHRRLREYPVTGGPSCFAESAGHEKLIQYGLRLLRELRWRGVAMVEFKRDSVTGEFVLMEINPRFWGSLPLAIAAGVDFPTLLYRVAREEDVRPVTEYRTGVKMRYLFQDVLSAGGYLRRVPDRGAFLLGFLRDLLDPQVVDGVFRLNDPVPGLVYLARAVRKAVRKAAVED